MTMTAWMLIVSLGYPSYGYSIVSGIASEKACENLAQSINAGTQQKGAPGERYPVWKCYSYEAAR